MRLLNPIRKQSDSDRLSIRGNNNSKLCSASVFTAVLKKRNNSFPTKTPSNRIIFKCKADFRSVRHSTSYRHSFQLIEKPQCYTQLAQFVLVCQSPLKRVIKMFVESSVFIIQIQEEAVRWSFKKETTIYNYCLKTPF